MPAGRYEGAIGALGNIETRLRRSLALAGIISAGFEPTAIPVLQADDLTRPGCNDISNRRFQATIATGIATLTTNSVTWRAVQPVIIDRIWFGVETANPVDATGFFFQLRLAAPGTADPYALAAATAASGNFVENFRAADDRPGFLVGNAAAAVATGTVIGSMGIRDALVLPVEFFIPAGGWLAVNVNHTGAATHQMQITLAGRMF